MLDQQICGMNDFKYGNMVLESDNTEAAVNEKRLDDEVLPDSSPYSFNLLASSSKAALMWTLSLTLSKSKIRRR